MKNLLRKLTFTLGAIGSLFNIATAETLSGKVIDAITEQPMQNISVNSRSKRTTTNEQGDYEIETPKIQTRIVYGKGEFYNFISGEKFVPHGNIYVDLEYFDPPDPRYIYWSLPEGWWSASFGKEYYDSSKAEQDLEEMKNSGYNVVRVYVDSYFHDFNSVLNGERMNRDYLDNFVDFLRIARDKEIYAIPSWGYLPETYNDVIDLKPAPENVDGFNAYFMHQGVIDAYGMYITDFLKEVEKRDSSLLNVIFGIEILNEPFFTTSDWEKNPAKPFSLRQGFVTPASGGTYDLSRVEEREKLIDDSTKYWLKQVFGRVKREYPSILLSAGGVFSPYATGRTGYDGLLLDENGKVVGSLFNDGRMPLKMSTLAESQFVDYLSFQGYPNPMDYSLVYDISKDMASIDINNVSLDKPRIINEFGVAEIYYPTIDKAVNALLNQAINSCNYGFEGWVLFTWNTEIPGGDGGWTAVEDGGKIKNALSPFLRPDICLLDNAVQNWKLYE